MLLTQCLLLLKLCVHKCIHFYNMEISKMLKIAEMQNKKSKNVLLFTP